MLRSLRRARSAVARRRLSRRLSLAGVPVRGRAGAGARPRVHRFAQVPQIGKADLPPVPLAVWIAGTEVTDDAARTRDALSAGTVPPAAVLDGALSDALAAVRAEHLVLMRAGDIPAPLALERLGQAAAMAPDARVITCDEDQLGDRWGAPITASAAGAFARPLAGLRRQRDAARRGPEPAAALLDGLGAGTSFGHELALALAGPEGGQHAHVPLLLCHRAAGDPRSRDRTRRPRAFYRAWNRGADGAGRREGRRPQGASADRRRASGARSSSASATKRS